MVKPNQPKGIKPKAEIAEIPVIDSVPSGNGLNSLNSMQFIIFNAIITFFLSALFLGGNYFIVNSVLNSKLAHLNSNAPAEEEGAEEGEQEEKPEKGVILDLGEFVLNLNDPNSKRYLKVNVALELSKSENDPEPAEGKGGGHGESKEAVDPYDIIDKEMKQYKPAIRDAIISVLSSKTTEELSNLTGKELAKEQIKEAIDPIFGGEREVLRVSFGTFIIQ